MDQHALIILLLFLCYFFVLTAVLQTFSNKFSFPYTVSLLLAGFLTQLFVHLFHLDIHITLTPEIIYFILLPLLLFESALHINIHQFKLQFKTITFLATFGLLISIFVIGFGGAYFLGLPLNVALLFGALISATDPIAVIALFKTLGAPKRLTLLADGESMFNDATAVIAFRIISGFTVGGAALGVNYIGKGVGNFIYIFIGSIIFGFITGYIASKAIEKIQNDKLVETTLTVALALFSFVGAEHFFHLSGVISTVIAGIVMGNLGRTKISSSATGFITEMWGYIAFVCVSLVFFFAAFSLDLHIFTKNPFSLFIMILIVLVARAISVYVTAFISNNLPFFNDEPDIPMSWQHILNWGGLRGVIPLVLVYSLPETFEYREEVLAFTLSALLFTLLVNGLTIRWLLVKLGLHLPKNEEVIIHDEMRLFKLAKSRRRLHALPKREFDNEVLSSFDQELENKELQTRTHLLEVSKIDEFLSSLKMQSLEIERTTLDKLYHQGRFTEAVYFEFESELDLQQDALEYPEAYTGRAITRGGMIDSSKSYRKRILRLRRALSRIPFLKNLLHVTEDDLIRERFGLLRARLLTSFAVIDYLDSVDKLFTKKEHKKAIEQVRNIQDAFIKRNQQEVDEMTEKYSSVIKAYQNRIIHSLIS